MHGGRHLAVPAGHSCSQHRQGEGLARPCCVCITMVKLALLSPLVASSCSQCCTYKLLDVQVMEDLAHANKYRICPEFVGHGVGRWFHSAPMVLPVASKMPDTMQVSLH